MIKTDTHHLKTKVRIVILPSGDIRTSKTNLCDKLDTPDGHKTNMKHEVENLKQLETGLCTV